MSAGSATRQRMGLGWIVVVLVGWYVYLSLVAWVAMPVLAGAATWAKAPLAPSWSRAGLAALALAVYLILGFVGMRSLRVLGAPQGGWIPAVLLTLLVLPWGLAGAAGACAGIWLGRGTPASAVSPSEPAGQDVVSCANCAHGNDFPDCPNDYAGEFEKDTGPGACVHYSQL